MINFLLRVDDEGFVGDNPASRHLSLKHHIEGAVHDGGLEMYVTVAPLPTVDDLLKLILKLHDDIGDGYHDGKDHAVDSTIEALTAAGWLPKLDKSQWDRIRYGQ